MDTSMAHYLPYYSNEVHFTVILAQFTNTTLIIHCHPTVSRAGTDPSIANGVGQTALHVACLWSASFLRLINICGVTWLT